MCAIAVEEKVKTVIHIIAGYEKIGDHQNLLNIDSSELQKISQLNPIRNSKRGFWHSF